MGNQLSGIAPSQILSVEHYFSDLSDFEFHCSLGSARFFKVARAKYREWLCMVKVFAIQDPSLPLKTYTKINSPRSRTGLLNFIAFDEGERFLLSWVSCERWRNSEDFLGFLLGGQL
ncbi:phosphoinositide 3-kinase regulatory subunit 4-like [Acropora millepora]|uniref:phosphoinositide 3-kinase regulatory subunit 4-like n=1 Tax=Acropora millepora TaxID=45264 RepID=UPI001CF300D7|nr:phosphoinositide 3-kinase regulatory subunit 4-like [Acropora millepora]